MGAAAAGTLAAGPFLVRSAAAAQTIKFGLLTDFSGPLAQTGNYQSLGMQLAIDTLNASGGLLGQKIEVIKYDAQSNVQLYTQYAQQLVLKDQVAVVHGGVTSASREAIRPIFDRAQTLYFYDTEYEGGVCDRNTFLTDTTPMQTISKLIPFAMKQSGKKVYIVTADYNYGQILAKWVTHYVGQEGGQIIGTELFPLDATNFSSSISKIQRAAPDLVVSVLVGSNQQGFYRQWEAAGMKRKIPIASATFGQANELRTMPIASTDGIMVAYNYFETLDNAANRRFAPAIHQRQGAAQTEICESISTPYEAVMIWGAAVKQAGSVQRDKVIAALESNLSIDGPSGKVTVDPHTHHTIRDIYLAQARGGKWNIVQTFPAQPPGDSGGECDLLKNPRTNKQFLVM